MKKRKKKQSNPNTDKIANADTLRNNTGRPWTMVHNTGPTIKRRRYQFGGKYNG